MEGGGGKTYYSIYISFTKQEITYITLNNLNQGKKVFKKS